MPIYEYACESCGHAFDALQKMNDDPLKDCPECNKPALKKLLSAPNFRLKGGGWYETDFKQDNQRNLADGTKKDAADKDGADKDGADKDRKSADDGKSGKTDKADKTAAKKDSKADAKDSGSKKSSSKKE